MYIYSKNNDARYIGERVTRNNRRFVFKTETRVGKKYENSPFYRGTVLWNKLKTEFQFSDNILLFKSHINKSLMQPFH